MHKVLLPVDQQFTVFHIMLYVPSVHVSQCMSLFQELKGLESAKVACRLPMSHDLRTSFEINKLKVNVTTTTPDKLR